MPDRDAPDNIFGEIKYLREDLRDFARRGGEDRKRAEDDRKKSDARFEALIGQMNRDRDRSDLKFDRMMKEIRVTGRRLVKTQEHHTKLLESIVRLLRAGVNGKAGNGHGSK